MATSGETGILLDMWQLYMQDLAQFRNLQVQADGRFRDDRLRTYLSYEDHWPFLFRSQSEIAGFALIRKSKSNTYLIGEFFIKSEFRRKGIGSAAVPQILQKFTGDWEIPFQNTNNRAAVFWRTLVAELGYEVSEIHKPVIGNPELPNDVWLSFTRTCC